MDAVDTQKIRKKYEPRMRKSGRPFYPAGGHDVRLLCDALDACRGERDEAKSENAILRRALRMACEDIEETWLDIDGAVKGYVAQAYAEQEEIEPESPLAAGWKAEDAARD